MENGNGELRQLLEIKRAYRQGLTLLEQQLKTEYERSLADGKKKLKEKYLEQIVDAVFAETAPAPPKAELPETSAPLETEPPKCPECGNPIDFTDKFCAECAAPLKEEISQDAPVVSTGRKLRTRHR